MAAVFITASLPPFARPGEKIDVTVSSVGDAKSLAGGVLLMSALHGPDGQIYAEAQGPLLIGGYSVGNAQNGKQVNTPTVGIVPNGGIVERDTAVDLHDFKTVSLLLRNPDFTTARQIADAVNDEFHKPVAIGTGQHPRRCERRRRRHAFGHGTDLAGAEPLARGSHAGAHHCE